MKKSSAQYVKEYRKRQKKLGLPDVTRKNRKKHKQTYKAKCKAAALGVPYVPVKKDPPIPEGFVHLPTGNLMDTRDIPPRPPATK